MNRSVRQGPLAQRLVQRTHNPLVDGSNPSGPTTFSVVYESVRLCKLCGGSHRGSHRAQNRIQTSRRCGVGREIACGEASHVQGTPIRYPNPCLLQPVSFHVAPAPLPCRPRRRAHKCWMTGYPEIIRWCEKPQIREVPAKGRELPNNTN